MIVDFPNMPVEVIPCFKGGEKELSLQSYDDGKNKIMHGILIPGASIGLHSHDADCEILFVLAGKGTLVDLFKKLVAEGLIFVADGFTIPSILEGHFKDKSGKWLTGLDNGDPVNNKALPVIQECIIILNASVNRLINGDFDEDEESRSEYDRYDQQDMHWHKK